MKIVRNLKGAFERCGESKPQNELWSKSGAYAEG
jgi:hypothetical protein